MTKQCFNDILMTWKWKLMKKSYEEKWWYWQMILLVWSDENESVVLNDIWNDVMKK